MAALKLLLLAAPLLAAAAAADNEGLVTPPDDGELVIPPRDEETGGGCAAFSDLAGDDGYWAQVSACGPCLQAGCGFCLSTLQCEAGDRAGPTSSLPCPAWVYDEGAAGCPEVPDCGALLSCGDCAAEELCAWCASASKCMTVEETFYEDCRGVVFDGPCPASHTPENRIVGNLVV